MSKVRIFGSDSRSELERQLTEFLSKLKGSNVRIIQLVSNGDTEAYAVLVAWDE